MGVGIATAEFLVEAASRGVSFERTGTVGRQAVFVGPGRLGRLLRRHSRWPEGLSKRSFLESFRDEPRLVEPLLRLLGAEDVQSIDASDYEGASIIHDLNRPVGEELNGRFSLLFDGGSLEHIFNVPVALANYMRMVEPGGHLIVSTMANNSFGHGFYQFGAEFFYRALSPENGFEVERLVVVENDFLWPKVLHRNVPVETAGRWYEVPDPREMRSRIPIQNRRRLVVQVQARRIAVVEPFRSPPQQSDYRAAWVEPEAQRPAPTRLGRRVTPELRAEVMLDVLPVALSLLNPWRFRREARLRSPRRNPFLRRVR